MQKHFQIKIRNSHERSQPQSFCNWTFIYLKTSAVIQNTEENSRSCSTTRVTKKKDCTWFNQSYYLWLYDMAQSYHLGWKDIYSVSFLSFPSCTIWDRKKKMCTIHLFENSLIQKNTDKVHSSFRKFKVRLDYKIG